MSIQRTANSCIWFLWTGASSGRWSGTVSLRGACSFREGWMWTCRKSKNRRHMDKKKCIVSHKCRNTKCIKKILVLGALPVCCRCCNTASFCLVGAYGPSGTGHTHIQQDDRTENIPGELPEKTGEAWKILHLKPSNICIHKTNVIRSRFHLEVCLLNSQQCTMSVMSSSVEGMILGNILNFFPNRGIWTIRQDGI